MNIKEFTLQQGFVLPILKSLLTLNKASSLEEILDTMITKEYFTPTECDLESIDFNSKVRFQSISEITVNNLIRQGFIVVSNNSYNISNEGRKKVDNEWSSYNQNNHIKKVSTDNQNKYIYFNIPSYLLHSSHKQPMNGTFLKHEKEYVKFLNDLVDYIDLNYPPIEDMINFLKNTYDFKNHSECLETINILRTSSLVKIIGKNLCLTKLGQWYINNYNNIALFRIFSNKYTGFEEIFSIICSNRDISIDSLKQLLISKYNFDWINSEQFDIRLHWMSDMDIIIINDSKITLSQDSAEFAVFLGFADESQISGEHTGYSSDNESYIPEPINLNITDINYSSELDDILDDIILESVSTAEYPEESEPPKAQESNTPQELFSKNINLSEQERNFLLNNIDVDSDIFSDNLVVEADINDDWDADETEEDFLDLDIDDDTSCDDEEDKKSPSIILQLPKKHYNEHALPQINEQPAAAQDMLISPDEIIELINLPKGIASKIASAFNMGKHIILTGPHGSGKTSIAVILAKIANKKSLNQGYLLTSADKKWTSKDTIGGLIETDTKKNIFKEGFVLKSIHENKWLIIDEINNCDTKVCFGELINSFYGHNTILSYMHGNYKNVEIISEAEEDCVYDINQYIKDKNWRIIATIDSSEKQSINFPSDFIRRFAFIDISINNYSSLIDEYFIKNNLYNDLLKTKIKAIFSETGILKYHVGASSIHDLIHYISIRSTLLDSDENMQDILAEGLELYIVPQIKILSEEIVREAQSYLLGLFDGYDSIKRHIANVL